MLAMSTLMMPAPTMACAPPIAVGPHKPPEAKLLAIHPTHAQTTPQHQIHAQQQQPQLSQQQQQQMSSSNKPGNELLCTGYIFKILPSCSEREKIEPAPSSLHRKCSINYISIFIELKALS